MFYWIGELGGVVSMVSCDWLWILILLNDIIVVLGFGVSYVWFLLWLMFIMLFVNGVLMFLLFIISCL